MELVFGIAIVVIITAHALKASITDVSYAARGKTSPRMKLRMKQLEAAAANGGKPVRYGLGGYLADLIDAGWTKARSRRDAKATAMPAGIKEKGPMRRYAGRVWSDAWDTMGRKHDVRRHSRLLKRGLADPGDAPFEPGPRETVDDVFDTAPRESPRPGHPHDEGDFRAAADARFTTDDLRRYAVWAKTRLPADRHSEVDDWVDVVDDAPCGMDRVTDVHDDLARWLAREHPGREVLERDQYDLGSDFNLGDKDPNSAAATSAPSVDGADVIPINRNQNRIFSPNRKDTNMTTSTDTEGGLETAIAWAEGTAKDATEMITVVEEAESNLQEGGVTGETITLMSEISETYETLSEQTTRLVEKLREQQQVAEAYEAVSDAGHRSFVTS